MPESVVPYGRSDGAAVYALAVPKVVALNILSVCHHFHTICTDIIERYDKISNFDSSFNGTLKMREGTELSLYRGLDLILLNHEHPFQSRVIDSSESPKLAYFKEDPRDVSHYIPRILQIEMSWESAIYDQPLGRPILFPRLERLVLNRSREQILVPQCQFSDAYWNGWLKELEELPESFRGSLLWCYVANYPGIRVIVKTIIKHRCIAMTGREKGHEGVNPAVVSEHDRGGGVDCAFVSL